MTVAEPLFKRSASNPILTAADLPYPANSVFNPGAARVGQVVRDGVDLRLVRLHAGRADGKRIKHGIPPRTANS